MMKIWLPLEEEPKEVRSIKTVRQLLTHFSLTEEEVLVVDKRDSKLLTADERLDDDQEIGLIRVLSGG